MLLLTIDNESSSVEKSNFTTFKNLFDFLSEELKNESRIIVSVEINDEKMTDGKQFDYFETAIDMIDSVKVTTADRTFLINEHLNVLKEHVETIERNIEKAIDFFRIGDDAESFRYFAAIIEGIRWFNYSIELIVSFLQIKVDETFIGGNFLNDTIANLSKIIDNLGVSQENKDTVMIADQLEYELLPLIKTWEETVGDFKKYI